MSLIRRNSGPLQRGTWDSSPRTKLVLFFVAFAVTYGAIRAWQIIIESDNVYLETGAAFITVIILFAIYWYYMRQYRAYRRRLNELRQAHPHPSAEEETDLNLVQLRLYLQRVYGGSVDIEALLASSGGLTIEVIDSLVRHYTYSSNKGSSCSVEDIELGLGSGLGRSMTLGRTDSNITATPPVSRYCSINKVDYDEDFKCSEETTLSASAAGQHSRQQQQAHMLQAAFDPPLECSVCLCEYCDGDAVSELPCRHTYHRVCITEWLLRHNACPMCKQMVLQLPVLETPLTVPELSDAASPVTSTSSGAVTSTGTSGSSAFEASISAAESVEPALVPVSSGHASVSRDEPPSALLSLLLPPLSLSTPPSAVLAASPPTSPISTDCSALSVSAVPITQEDPAALLLEDLEEQEDLEIVENVRTSACEGRAHTPSQLSSNL